MGALKQQQIEQETTIDPRILIYEILVCAYKISSHLSEGNCISEYLDIQIAILLKAHTALKGISIDKIS